MPVYAAAALLLLSVAGMVLSLVENRRDPHPYWKWFLVLCAVITVFSFLFLLFVFLLVLSID